MLTEEKVFKDSVHGYIHVTDELIWNLIQTKEFQRLRRIHQLGGSYMTFHTAEHSRFSHSLGVYEVARQMITKVEDLKFTERERLLTLSAALLHDLGHGPFSHAFEHVAGVEHEEFTKKIILGETEVNKVLRSIDDKFPKDVSNIISKEYSNPLIVSIISSQIDADRIDYLLRDGYNTGVRYGQIDLDRLLRVMRVINNEIVFKESGIKEIENYIVGRYHMYWQLYFHPTSRAYELILLKLLQRCRELYESNYNFKIVPTKLINLFKEQGNIDINDYLDIDESDIFVYSKNFMLEEDQILSDLADRFINRRLFKYSNYYPEGGILGETERLRMLFKLNNIDPTYYLITDSSSKIPYDLYNSNGHDLIKIYTKSNMVKELSEVSRLVYGITRSENEIDYKLYYPLDLINKIDNNVFKDEIYRILFI